MGCFRGFDQKFVQGTLHLQTDIQDSWLQQGLHQDWESPQLRLQLPPQFLKVRQVPSVLPKRVAVGALFGKVYSSQYFAQKVPFSTLGGADAGDAAGGGEGKGGVSEFFTPLRQKVLNGQG